MTQIKTVEAKLKDTEENLMGFSEYFRLFLSKYDCKKLKLKCGIQYLNLNVKIGPGGELNLVMIKPRRQFLVSSVRRSPLKFAEILESDLYANLNVQFSSIYVQNLGVVPS